jgi:hypothetical protein
MNWSFISTELVLTKENTGMESTSVQRLMMEKLRLLLDSTMHTKEFVTQG